MGDKIKYKAPAKGTDDIVRERHAYSGPLGDGFIEYEYKVTASKMYCKFDHYGPEDRVSQDWTEVKDLDTTESQQTSTTPVVMEVVKYVETTPGSGVFDNRIVVEETHNQPVYTDVAVTKKHPYKAQFFGL